MAETLTFKAQEYRCDPCTAQKGTPVRELIRMIPVSVVAFGKLVGDEYYCCPICFEPKFQVKSRKPVNAVRAAQQSRRRANAAPAIRLVKG